MGRRSFLNVLCVLCHTLTKARGMDVKKNGHIEQSKSENDGIGSGGSATPRCSLDLAGGGSGLVHTFRLTQHDPGHFIFKSQSGKPVWLSVSG